ncbi:hypothetical protein DCS_04538 [Drechmeria coniospora]|uniref:Uncharacterized protein n=1 Tax=Drechmeria coniospora TaxID=98403 RepID=A0A151GKA9_DRECN|nr:hypothetical protein DCS_04538 [Drechmeria coniospora]KYK57528.1 hypothetical protein DCS_04538 [Drechmeria coniospora]ODA79415.1 hypothetical protein RJ55_05008 [Drechmeria coniospora]
MFFSESFDSDNYPSTQTPKPTPPKINCVSMQEPSTLEVSVDSRETNTTPADLSPSIAISNSDGLIEYCRILSETRRMECQQLREVIRALENKINRAAKRQDEQQRLIDRQQRVINLLEHDVRRR